MSARLIAYAVVAGALLIIGGQWHERGQRLETLRAANAQITADHAQCTAQQAADDQALAALRAAGEADRARRAEAERAAAQASVDAEKRVAKALMSRVPTECPAAVQWLGEYGRGLAAEWGAVK